MNEQDLLSRAHATYFATGKHDGVARLQPSRYSNVGTTAYGRNYVVLRNVSGVLAVFRIRTPSGALRRLKRWPASLEQC